MEGLPGWTKVSEEIRMVKSWAEYDCTDRFSKESNIYFRKFPLKDEVISQKWIVATKRLRFNQVMERL